MKEFIEYLEKSLEIEKNSVLLAQERAERCLQNVSIIENALKKLKERTVSDSPS